MYLVLLVRTKSLFTQYDSKRYKKLGMVGIEPFSF